jgi:hypothetical protein
VVVLVMGLAAGLAAASCTSAARAIPELAWEPRSDWINVRTDVSPRAVGDGAADDTAALQAALGVAAA